MKRTVFADTFYYFGVVNPDDAAHAAALAIGEAANLRVVTTEWVLLEAADGLASGRNRRIASELIRSVRSDPRSRVVPFRRGDFEKALKLYTSRPDKEWSLTDCTSFVIMDRLRLRDALTADKHFVQAGFVAMLA